MLLSRSAAPRTRSLVGRAFCQDRHPQTRFLRPRLDTVLWISLAHPPFHAACHALDSHSLRRPARYI